MLFILTMYKETIKFLKRGKFMKKNALVLLIGTMMILAGCGSKTADKADAVAAEVIEEASDAIDDANEEVAEAVRSRQSCILCRDELDGSDEGD